MKKILTIFLVGILLSTTIAIALELPEPDRPKTKHQKFCGFVWGNFGEQGCFCPPSMETHRWMRWWKCERPN